MIQRKILQDLFLWKERDDRKPLVLRGARQVGKTTVVEEFAKSYGVFLHLNLEKELDRQLFESTDDVDVIIRNIFYHKKKLYQKESVLLFIDEIQFSKRAIALLRYFYEEANYINVIVAGSLLETVIDVRKISFPVGRVEYMAVRPCSFLEFLNGLDNDFDAGLVENMQVNSVIHNRVMSYFHNYVLVGGMPAAISQYAKNRDLLSVKRIYESILLTYRDDIEKYTADAASVKVIRSILDTGWQSAAECISFEKFGNTSFKSKEMSLAFQTIQKAMLLELSYPTSSTQMPLMQNYRRQPKLLWLDTGLVNYFSGIQHDVFLVKEIQDVWRGRIAEHIVAQELLTLDNSLLTKRIYWRRDKNTSEAEVDFVYKYNSLAIPVEVKSGHNSKLNSLHLYMNECPHNWAIRVWSQPLSVDEVITQQGKTFKLINLPFYYVGVLDKVLSTFTSY